VHAVGCVSHCYPLRSVFTVSFQRQPPTPLRASSAFPVTRRVTPAASSGRESPGVPAGNTSGKTPIKADSQGVSRHKDTYVPPISIRLSFVSCLRTWRIGDWLLRGSVTCAPRRIHDCRDGQIMKEQMFRACSSDCREQIHMKIVCRKTWRNRTIWKN
jgi:hypothetical protein